MILGVLLYVFLKPLVINNHKTDEKKYKHQPTHITIVSAPNQSRFNDDRYTRAPEPIRRPMYGQVPSIATRGEMGPYQQMGILERRDGTFYPLYGRRTYHSDKFNYYTRTDTYNPVQLPIKYNKRDCTDDNGCNEVSDGDAVRIGDMEEAKVKLYTSSFIQ